MMIPGSVEYAQVRIQSRHAARPDVSAWREMERARELSPLIEVARRSGFDRVVARLPMPLELHELDFAMRKQWHERVNEVAGWMSDDWQAAVRWCALIVDLPFIQYLADGGVAHEWMQRGESFASPGAAPDGRIAATTQAEWTLGGLHQPWVGPETVASALYREWRGRMPRLPEEQAAQFRVFVHAVESHLGAFSKAAVDEGWHHRHLLEQRLNMLFRRATLEPLAAFAFLALYWLDLERLRGEIARRIAFPLRSLVP